MRLCCGNCTSWTELPSGCGCGTVVEVPHNGTTLVQDGCKTNASFYGDYKVQGMCKTGNMFPAYSLHGGHHICFVVCYHGIHISGNVPLISYFLVGVQKYFLLCAEQLHVLLKYYKAASSSSYRQSVLSQSNRIQWFSLSTCHLLKLHYLLTLLKPFNVSCTWSYNFGITAVIIVFLLGIW